MRQIYLLFICLFCFSMTVFGQDGHNHDHDHAGHDHSQHSHGHDEAHHDAGHANECGHVHDDSFDAGATAFHHISDQNIYNIGPFNFPLPCFLKSDAGWDFFSSGKFNPDYHGNGTLAINRYLLHEGVVRRVADGNFKMGDVNIGEHNTYWKKDSEGKDYVVLCHAGREWDCENQSTLDGGLFGGGITSFSDFSITKNVVSMMIVFFLMAWIFLTCAKAYKTRDGQAPKGLQGFMEPIFIFIQDEVAKPFLGHHWEKFTPFLMSLFFFILGLNLFGQIPFFGGSNVTGNLAVTMVLAICAFVITNINGNKHYWGHIFNMPGVPLVLKVLIITPVEILGLFIKPLTLMLRLFANITAGHMVIIIFVGLIFMFGEMGGPGAAWGTSIGSTLLTLFMMSIELLVAFIQAFVFTILTASYIGAATEEAHH